MTLEMNIWTKIRFAVRVYSPEGLDIEVMLYRMSFDRRRGRYIHIWIDGPVLGQHIQM